MPSSSENTNNRKRVVTSVTEFQNKENNKSIFKLGEIK